MAFGLRKSAPEPTPEKEQKELPTEQVFALRQQGLSNNQIIQSLQQQGFSSTQILDAINQADTIGGVGTIPQANYPQGQPVEQPAPQVPQQYPEQAYPQQGGFYAEPEAKADTEELVEAIIEEKWNELMRDINRIIEWKNKTETRINSLDQQFKDLKDNFDKLHSALIGKIGEYDKNILEVGTEIKAMEKVFQKVLPTFTSTVNELSRITGNLKKQK